MSFLSTLGSFFNNNFNTGMDEPHQTIELTVKPRSCTKETHHAVAKICVPWTNGFERFHFFT